MPRGSGRHGTGRVPRTSRRQVTERLPVRVEDAEGRARGGATVDVYIGGWRTERTTAAIADEAPKPEATVGYAQHAVSGETGGDGVAAFPPAREWGIENSEDRFEGQPDTWRRLPEAIDPLDRPRETLVTVVAGYDGTDRWFGAEHTRLATLLEATAERPLTVGLTGQRLFGPEPLTADVETGLGTVEGVQYGAVTVWRSVPDRVEAATGGEQYLNVEISAARQLPQFSGRTPRTGEGRFLYGEAGTDRSEFESTFPTIDTVAPFDTPNGVFEPPSDGRSQVTPPALTTGSVTLYVEEDAVAVPGRTGTEDALQSGSRSADGPYVLDRGSGPAALGRALHYRANRGGVLGDAYGAPVYPQLRYAFERWRPGDRDGGPGVDGLLSLLTSAGGPVSEAVSEEGAERAVRYINGLAGTPVADPERAQLVDGVLDAGGRALGETANAVGLLQGIDGVVSELTDDPLNDEPIGGGLDLSPNDAERFGASWSFDRRRGRSVVLVRLPIRFQADAVSVGVEAGWTGELELQPPSAARQAPREPVVERLLTETRLRDRRVPEGGGEGA